MNTAKKFRFIVGMSAALLLMPDVVHAWPHGYSGPGWGYGWPGSYYAKYRKQFQVGKVDLDADLNYDGVVNNGDPSDGGTREDTPPGLVVGRGEMSKLIFRVAPNMLRQQYRSSEPEFRFDFTKLVVSLDLRGINLSDKKGRFSSFEEETSKCGHTRVWSDEKRSQLLLDSANPGLRRIEWPMDLAEAPYSVYIEGVRPGTNGACFFVTLELDDSGRKGFGKLFDEMAAWDSLFVTCREQGVPKVAAEKTDLMVVSGYNTYGGFAATEKDSRKVWVRVPTGGGDK